MIKETRLNVRGGVVVRKSSAELSGAGRRVLAKLPGLQRGRDQIGAGKFCLDGGHAVRGGSEGG